MFRNTEALGKGIASSCWSGLSDDAICRSLALGSCMCRLRVVPTVIGVVYLASEMADIENGNFS